MHLTNRGSAISSLSIYFTSIGCICIHTPLHAHIITVLEGDFLTRYFASIGDFSLFGSDSDFTSEFISDLRDNLEFNPRDDDDDDEGDEDSDSDNEETTDGGFNIRGFLRNVTSRLEDRAIERITQSAQTAQCIRRVVEVLP